MPGSASSWTHRPEDLITRLRSAASSGEAKLKALRELKNQIIGNPTKKLSYIKLGAVPSVVLILSEAASVNVKVKVAVVNDSLLVESAAAIGSFACGGDVGVKAVLDAGAFPHLLSLISHPNDKVLTLNRPFFFFNRTSLNFILLYDAQFCYLSALNWFE